MGERLEGLDQKVAAYERHCNAMSDRTTPTGDFNGALNALKILNRDTKGTARTLFVSRLHIRR